MDGDNPEIISGMCPPNERWRYITTLTFIGWAHIQNDPCDPVDWFLYSQRCKQLTVIIIISTIKTIDISSYVIKQCIITNNICHPNTSGEIIYASVTNKHIYNWTRLSEDHIWIWPWAFE